MNCAPQSLDMWLIMIGLISLAYSFVLWRPSITHFKAALVSFLTFLGGVILFWVKDGAGPVPMSWVVLTIIVGLALVVIFTNEKFDF